jgi:hypothetical protein
MTGRRHDELRLRLIATRYLAFSAEPIADAAFCRR